MIKADLQAAGIAPADTGAGRLDFHALRHTFGTLLAASGVHPKTAQDLMRHSDINLTMTRYTHTLRGQQAAAIEALPVFTVNTEMGQVRMTGTDGAAELHETAQNRLSFCLSILSRKHRNLLDNSGQKSENMNCVEQGHTCDKMQLFANRKNNASVAELADALDLGSSTERYGGSTPLARSQRRKWCILPVFIGKDPPMNMPSFLCIGLMLGLVSCQNAGSSSRPLIPEGTAVLKLADGFAFTEGPAADAGGDVYFTDIPNNRIHKWSVKEQAVSTWRENTGGANGLFFDPQGNLLACEGGNRRMVKIDPKGNLTVLAEWYNGKRLNSPNDLWIDPKNGVYFSDPRYGKMDDLEQTGEYVYYLPPAGGQPIRVIDDFVKPNGLIGTPDGKILYATDRKGNQTFRYRILPDGTLTEKTFFAPYGSDGMTIDKRGNIYLTTDCVRIFNADGKPVGHIEVPEQPSNVCFGGKNRKTLFITARKSLYMITMNVQGVY